MLQPGKYIAKPVEIRATVSPKKGTLGISVKFKLKPTETIPENTFMTWTGYCTSAALPFTMQTLKDRLDYNGDDRIVDAAPDSPDAGLFADQDCINRKEPIELDIEDQGTGDRPDIRIKWINKLGGGNQFAGATPQQVKQVFAAVGFKAAFLATGQTQTPKQNPVHNEQANLTDEDVPF